MNTYYFTFGQKYRQEKHPQGGHPDGWFAIEAPTEEEARQRMEKWCGPKWAFSYDAVQDKSLYPLGELKRLKFDEPIPETPKEPERPFESDKWLIFSLEHNGWWMPASHGYTQKRSEAGHYTFEQAIEIVRGANEFISGNRPNETMCPVWQR